MTLPAFTNRAVFRAYVDEVVLPTLGRAKVVLLDTLSAHKYPDVEAAVRAAGYRLLFLPRYSLEYNPIEPCWSKVKNELRSRAARTLEHVQEAVRTAWTPPVRRTRVATSDNAATRRLVSIAAAGGASPRLPYVSSWFASDGVTAYPLSRALPVHHEAHQLVVRVVHLPPAALHLFEDGGFWLRGGYRPGGLRVVRHRVLRALAPGRPAGQRWSTAGLRAIRL